MNPFKWRAVILGPLLALLGPASPLSASDEPPSFDPQAFAAKLTEDSEVIQSYRKKLSYIADYVLMDAVPPEGLKKESYQENLRETWVSFLDYLIALDSIGRSYGSFLDSRDRTIAKEAFDARYWIFLSEYRYAAQFAKNLEGIPGVDPLLNQPIPELDLPGNSYASFRSLALGAEKTAELFAKDKIFFSFGTGDNQGANFPQIQEDKTAVLRLCSPLHLMELKKIGEEKPPSDGFSPWVPLLKARPPWGGKTSFWRNERSSLTQAQVKFLLDHLEPGDILLSRKECYFPAVGLPGYWSQAALYLGDEAQRKVFFDDPQVKGWLKEHGRGGTFEDLLGKEFKSQYPSLLTLDGRGHLPRVLEAVPEGVLLCSLERYAETDSLCVLRPRSSKAGKANALFRALRCLGKPYDFNFNFESDGEMTGAEMVAFSYKPMDEFQGLLFPFSQMLGHYFSSPNLMARQFDEQFGAPGQQSDLVVFLERESKVNHAEFNGLGEFRQTWKKPKWTPPALPNP